MALLQECPKCKGFTGVPLTAKAVVDSREPVRSPQEKKGDGILMDNLIDLGNA